jgi:ribokinase
MDLVMNVDKMVQVGETILAKSFKKISGGKGANQAVAAGRLGAKVSMIGKLGNDDNGNEIYKCLQIDEINTQNILHDDVNPTGMAIISVNAEGNNSIVVVSGSNMNITKEDIQKCKETIINSDVIVAQFETPIESTIEAFKIAKENGVMTVLNPAPASRICDELMSLTDILIPNETEAMSITNVKVENEETAKKAAEIFLNKGVHYVIITLGDKGAALISKEQSILVPAYKVNAVDTTAAGDGFIGALVTKLNISSKDNDMFDALKEAIQFGNKVSSLIVQRQGAQTSLPTMDEVIKSFEEVNK